MNTNVDLGNIRSWVAVVSLVAAAIGVLVVVWQGGVWSSRLETALESMGDRLDRSLSRQDMLLQQQQGMIREIDGRVSHIEGRMDRRKSDDG